jgi:hypothetical protein
MKMPHATLAPISVALLIAGTFVGLLMSMWWVAAGCLLAMIPALLWWFWPSPEMGWAERARP